MTPPISQPDAVQFVLNEARLLNDARYDEWLSLFAEDGHYWVPLGGDQQVNPVEHASIAYEDKLLLSTRIRRLKGSRAHSIEPGVRGMHLLQTPRIDSASTPGEQLVYTPFLYVETRGDRLTNLVGIWRHVLRSTPTGFLMVLKRVDLLNAGAAHESIQLFP